MIELLIVIPVFNEAKRLESNVKRVVNFFDLRNIHYKIVLAVDPSPDDSIKIALELKELYNSVDVIVGSMKRGRGYAVRRAWAEYEANSYSFIDADLSSDEKSLLNAFNLINENKSSFVIGSRYSSGSKTVRPPLRRVVSFSYNVIMNKIFDNKIDDYQCGLKIVSRNVRNHIINLSKVDSWFWDAEVIVIALRLGIQIHQLPIQWQEYKYKRTNLKRLVHDTILHGWGLISLYKRMRKGEEFKNYRPSEIHAFQN